MMAIPHTKSSLRFRQWSRKTYAVFRSIGRHVTIGSIKNIVADALLGKQNTIPATAQAANMAHADVYDKEYHPPDDWLELLLLQTPLSLSKKVKGTGAFTGSVIVIYKRLKAGSTPLFSAFLRRRYWVCLQKKFPEGKTAAPAMLSIFLGCKGLQIF